MAYWDKEEFSSKVEAGWQGGHEGRVEVKVRLIGNVIGQVYSLKVVTQESIDDIKTSWERWIGKFSNSIIDNSS